MDVDKYYVTVLGGKPSISRKLRFWLLNSDFHAVACFRYGEAARRLRRRSRSLGLFPVLLHSVWRRWMSTVHHVNIDNDADIGAGFCIMHRNGLFIGPVTIGENCVIHHNVTMGARVAKNDASYPMVGRDVWIGPGVIISGGIKINDGATLSAGTVVSKDIPARSLVNGNPGRVVLSDYDNRLLINYPPIAISP